MTLPWAHVLRRGQLGRHAGVGVGIALAVAGCRQTVVRDGCDVCTTSAVVYGNVRDATGTPVPNVVIQIQAFASNDSGLTSPVGGTNITPQSDAFGAYRDQPLSPLGPFHAVVAVRATPPRTSGFLATTVSGAHVDFRSDFDGGSRDSIQVDIVLPRASAP
jgi:hypothetical protein